MQNKEEEQLQTIYVNIDDSGKLVNSEKVAIYAGLVFTSKYEKDKFCKLQIIFTIKKRDCFYTISSQLE